MSQSQPLIFCLPYNQKDTHNENTFAFAQSKLWSQRNASSGHSLLGIFYGTLFIIIALNSNEVEGALGLVTSTPPLFPPVSQMWFITAHRRDRQCERLVRLQFCHSIKTFALRVWTAFIPKVTPGKPLSSPERWRLSPVRPTCAWGRNSQRRKEGRDCTQRIHLF